MITNNNFKTIDLITIIKNKTPINIDNINIIEQMISMTLTKFFKVSLINKENSKFLN